MSTDEDIQKQEAIDRIQNAAEILLSGLNLLENDVLKKLQNSIELLEKGVIKHDDLLREYVPKINCIQKTQLERDKLKEDEKKHLDEINKLGKQGKFSEALSLIRAQLSKYGKSADVWYRRGFLYTSTKSYDNAIRSYKKAQEIGYKDEKCISCSIGETYIQLGKFKEAKKELENVIFVDPQITCLHYLDLLGMVYSNVGTVEELDNLVLELVNNADDPKCTVCMKAKLYYWMKAYDKALKLTYSYDFDCNGISFQRLVLNGLLGKKKEGKKSFDKLNFTFQINVTRFHMFRDLISFFDSEEDRDALKRLAGKLMDEVKWKRETVPLGMLLEYLSNRALSIGCEDHDFYIDILNKAKEYHDCPYLDCTIIHLLREANRFDEAIEFSFSQIKKYPEVISLLVEAGFAFYGAGFKDLTVITVLMGIQLDISHKTVNSLYMLSILAQKVGSIELFNQIKKDIRILKKETNSKTKKKT